MKNLLNKTTFIVGNKKNAGKTTFLSFALASLRPACKPAYLSIGVDGEGVDAITGGHKPKVYAEKGDVLVTTESAISHSKLSAKVLNVFPYKTVLGRPVVVEVSSGGFIELVGPENNTQLGEICGFIQDELDIKTILIDGAVNRITQIGSSSDSGFVYVTRIDPSNLQSAVEHIKLLYLLSKVPVMPAKKMPEVVEVSGALTNSSLGKLENTKLPLLLDDLTKVFLEPRAAMQVLKSRGFYFKRTFELRFIVANLFDVDGSLFRKTLNDEAVYAKVAFNPYRET